MQTLWFPCKHMVYVYGMVQLIYTLFEIPIRATKRQRVVAPAVTVHDVNEEERGHTNDGELFEMSNHFSICSPAEMFRYKLWKNGNKSKTTHFSSVNLVSAWDLRQDLDKTVWMIII